MMPYQHAAGPAYKLGPPIRMSPLVLPMGVYGPPSSPPMTGGPGMYYPPLPRSPPIQPPSPWMGPPPAGPIMPGVGRFAPAALPGPFPVNMPNLYPALSPVPSALPMLICTICRLQKPQDQFYTEVRCPDHGDYVCYRCILSLDITKCPKCHREYSANEARYMPTLIASLGALQ